MEKKSKQVKLNPVDVEVVEPESEVKEIAPIQQPPVQIQNQGNSIDILITKAVEHNASIETMERILAMRRELKAERAKEEFDNAMASFQGKCPTIKKNKNGGKTESGAVAYRYAPLDSIVEQTKELISEYGFSYQIKTETGQGRVKAICIVKHRMGHSEQSEVEVPFTTRTKIMSEAQQVAATITFAKRYAFTNAFGIMTGDEDNDGADIKPATQTKPQSRKMTLEQTISSLRICRDPLTLKNTRKNIESSTIYTETQKRVILQTIDDSLNICQS